MFENIERSMMLVAMRTEQKYFSCLLRFTMKNISKNEWIFLSLFINFASCE